MRIELQPAYVLHTRHYRDSSLLIELLTPNYGRVSGVVRGVRSAGKVAKQRRSLIQPFLPLLISWSGHTDLKTMTYFESCGAAIMLTGPRLFSAMYINELLTRLLPHYDENPDIFLLYQWLLVELPNCERIEVILRQFEIQLLDHLGYGIDLTTDAHTGLPLSADIEYRFETDNGFVSNSYDCTDKGCVFLGADLIAIRDGDYSESARRCAKRLCRLALSVHLGTKPLKSRELFG